jgi:hypothetical protein
MYIVIPHVIVIAIVINIAMFIAIVISIVMAVVQACFWSNAVEIFTYNFIGFDCVRGIDTCGDPFSSAL